MAVLDLPPPTLTEFTLRGNVPVPKGFYHGNGVSPLTVLDYDGTPVPTQVEVVSRYPKTSHGADVVEVLARVRRDPALALGERARYSVIVQNSPGAQTLGDELEALLYCPTNVAQTVCSLLVNPYNAVLIAEDVFGNFYYRAILDNPGQGKLMRIGQIAGTLRTYGVMKPVQPKQGANRTLPHMFGVHAYLTTRAQEAVVGLDLRFTNGADGHDPTTDEDDAIGKFYFKSLALIVPPGWSVQQQFPDPNFGPMSKVLGVDVIPIVRETGDGTLHVMPSNAQFHRRLALAPTEVGGGVHVARARAYLDQQGQAFCVRGTNAAGQALWSWWNPDTARFLSVRHRLPSLEHMNAEDIRAALNTDYNLILDFMTNGTSYGNYPVKSNVLGWAHPYGVGTGGMTGGDEIHFYPGVKTAWTGSANGYRLFQLMHRMHTDRMPNAYYNVVGEPSSVEQWLVHNPGGKDYIDMVFYMSWYGGNDPMGYSNVDTYQVDTVAALGKKPAYESELRSYAHHDMQHLIRYTRNAKVLVWLGNDDVARDDLMHQAEICHLTYNEHANGVWGNLSVVGMAWDRDYVDQRPSTGYPTGRGEGWAIDAMAAAYSIADPAWRSSKRPWFDELSDLLMDGQATCSGFYQATVYDKLLQGMYRGRRSFEQSIMENAIRGVIESVYRGETPGMAAALEASLLDSLRASVSTMAWATNEQAPYFQTAVGPLDLNAPVFCNYLPPDGYSDQYDLYQLWSSLGYGWELSNDVIFLQKAETLIGGTQLLPTLLADGTKQIETRAALLATLQVP